MKRYIRSSSVTASARVIASNGNEIKEIYDVIFYDAEEDDFNVQFQKYCTQAEIDAIVKKLNKENQVAGNYFAELA